MNLESLLWLLEAFNIFVLSYFVVINGMYIVTNAMSFRWLRRYARRLKTLNIDDLITFAGAPPLTLVAPGYNEEATCVESTKSFLTLRYPEVEILFVNDGSKDGTLARMIEAFALEKTSRLRTANIPAAKVRAIYRSRTHPNLWVIDKENGGKADALNTGINYCHTPLFCAMDADTLLEPEALMRAVRPFLEDQRTIAAGGIIRIANGCTIESGRVVDVALPTSWLARFQVLEYLRAFLAGRVGWDRIGMTVIISGAFGVFRRSAVVEVGGYYTKTVGEDMELVVRLHRRHLETGRPYRVAYLPDPIAWTECPTDTGTLGRQRDRWHRGTAEILWRHRGMFFNPRHRAIGLIALPFFALELIAPLVELLGILAFGLTLALGRGSWPYSIAFLMVAIVLGTVLSIASLALEELTFHRYKRHKDLLWLLLVGVIENFGYRQMTVYWRLRGFVTLMRKKKQWGAMRRSGFGTNPTPPATQTPGGKA